MIAPKGRAVGLTQTAIKVASGAAESVPYITVTNPGAHPARVEGARYLVYRTDAEAKTICTRRNGRGRRWGALGGEGMACAD